MTKFSQNILDKIKEDGLKPRPKWVFVLWNIALLVSFVLAIMAGGMVMGVIILKLSHWELGYIHFLGDGVSPGFWEILPLMWGLLLLLVLYISSKFFESIEGAYKYSHWLVLLVVVLISVGLGGILYATRLSDMLEDVLRDNLALYEQMESNRDAKWYLPQRGLLPGRVEEVRGDGFDLLDIKGNEWEIVVNNDLLKEIEVKNGQIVMVMGAQVAEGQFVASDLKVKRAFGGLTLKKLLPPPPRNKKRIDPAANSNRVTLFRKMVFQEV